MSSSITMKSNPFQRANPFQVQSSFQSQINSSLGSYVTKPTYHTFQPQIQSYSQKQNNYIKKPQPQLWKFRQDNCGKSRVFNHQSNISLHQKHIQQKNSFQKQLVISSVGRRNNNNYGQQVNHQKQRIQNPFGRKYLMTNNYLAQSQVYAGFAGKNPIQQKNNNYDRYKPQFQNYTSKVQYNAYQPVNYSPIQQTYSNNLNTVIGSHNHLQTSLHQKYSYQNQYASRKSIQRQNSYGKYQSNKNQVESRYSLQRQKDNYRYNGSNKDIYPPSNKDIYQPSSYKDNYPPIPSMKESYSKGSRMSGAQRDRPSQQRYGVTQKQQKVNFQSSDDQNCKDQSRTHPRQPTFGSKKVIPQLKGPSEITVNGCKFYRQKIQCY